VGIRGKQIATLTLVAGAVALATSLMNAASLARLSALETRGRLELLASTFFHQASRVIREQGGEDLRKALASDPSLRNYAEAIVGYSPTTLYVAITDDRGTAILHSDPGREGSQLTSAGSLEEFSARNGFSQLLAMSRGHQALEVELPFIVDDRPFGSVRVAVSTLLLKEELSGAIAVNAVVAAGVVLVSFLASVYLANRLLAPIELLRRELARIDTGRGEPPLDLRDESDISRITEFFASVGRKLAEDRQIRDGGSSWLETMLGGLTDAVIVVSSEYKILSLNDPACQLLGRTRADIQGTMLSESLPDGHPIALLVSDALSHGEAVGPLNVPLDVRGRTVPHTLTAQMLRGTDGVFGALVSARDLEKLSRLGSHQSYTQKLTALGRLTSGVAHEIGNPLNAMAIHVALLRQRIGDTGSEARGYLDVLDEEIRRLDRVIQGFLKFTRPEELKLVSLTLGELLGEVLRLVSGEADMSGVQIVTDVPEELPPVHGDRELLQQAILNLMLNACEAMPDGGALRVTTRRSSDGQLVLDIEDTGVGIASEDLPKIFDLYYTTKSGGSGIGLSLVYRIIQLHDGEVSVTSSPGEGTRFTIKLPEVGG